MGQSQLNKYLWPPFVRTLRFRLMLWNALLVIVTAGATLIGLREGIRFALLHELDQILYADLDEIAIALEESHGPTFANLLGELDRKARSHHQQGWFVKLLDQDRRTIWSSSNPERVMRDVQGDGKGAAVYGSELRIHERRLSPRSKRVRTVRVGADLTFLAHEMSRIDHTAERAAVVALVFAPLGGYVLATQAIRPLRHLTQVAARLRPGLLRERLPLRDSGDELDHLSQTINGLLDGIAAHMAQRRDLLANSAHELRSPLAAIRSSVEVALQSGRTLAEYEELLGEVMDECSTLQTLVNQLLLLAETEANRDHVRNERVAWSELVSKAVSMFGGAAEYAQLAMSAEIMDDLHVMGNPEHLRQVLNNLLDNAIKFTPPEGRVTVRLDRQASSAVLTVSDSGHGIPAEDLPLVFNRFYRGDRSRSRALVTGTGLGLSICQAVVRAHHGEITLASQLGTGTTVTVSLPLAENT